MAGFPYPNIYFNCELTFDPVAEARLIWKIYIVPVVSIIYLFGFIDRANIGAVIRQLKHCLIAG